jgi:hypothetical protein
MLLRTRGYGDARKLPLSSMHAELPLLHPKLTVATGSYWVAIRTSGRVGAPLHQCRWPASSREGLECCHYHLIGDFMRYLEAFK